MEEKFREMLNKVISNINMKEMEDKQKLGVAYIQLSRRREEAQKEIESHKLGSKDPSVIEATEDIKRIDGDLLKIEQKKEEITKTSESKRQVFEQALTELDQIVAERQSIQKQLEDINTSMEELKKRKEEAEKEIVSHKIGRKDASFIEANSDIEKINNEINQKNKLRENNENILEQLDEKQKLLALRIFKREEYDKIMNRQMEDAMKQNEEINRKEEAKRQLYEDWDMAIAENAEFDRNKALENTLQQEIINRDWEAAIKENEEFDRRKAREEKAKARLNKDWEAAIKENEEFDKRKAAEEAARKKAEEEAKKKAAEEAARKKAEEAKRKAAMGKKKDVKGKDNAKKKTQKPAKAKNEKPKVKEAIKITYYAKSDKYVIQIPGYKKTLTLSREEVSANRLDREELSFMYNVKPENIKYIDPDIESILSTYDEAAKTREAEKYVKLMTTIGKSKAEKREKMLENGLEINYNLKGLYDKIQFGKSEYDIDDAFTIAERQEILANANNAKDMGVAKVKKGLKVLVLEQIDKISINSTKKDRLLNSGSKERYSLDREDKKTKKNIKERSVTKHKRRVKNYPNREFAKSAKRFGKGIKDKLVKTGKAFMEYIRADDETLENINIVTDRWNQAARDSIDRVKRGRKSEMTNEHDEEEKGN